MTIQILHSVTRFKQHGIKREVVFSVLNLFLLLISKLRSSFILIVSYKCKRRFAEWNTKVGGLASVAEIKFKGACEQVTSSYWRTKHSPQCSCTDGCQLETLPFITIIGLACWIVFSPFSRQNKRYSTIATRPLEGVTIRCFVDKGVITNGVIYL